MALFRKKTTPAPDLYSPELARVDETVPLIAFEAYGVRVLHPQDWRIFINPSKPFLYQDGYAKIDRSVAPGAKKLEVSLSLRWARIEKVVSIDEYVEEIKRQYELKQKKNKSDSFVIDDIHEVEGLPHKAFSIESSIMANHSIYRVLKSNEFFKSLEYVTRCPETERIVMATLCAYCETFEQNRDLFVRMLGSLKCHHGAD